MTPPIVDPIAYARTHAPWLCAPELGACLVGSAALAIACERAGVAGPRPKDVDFAWALDVEAGRALLERHSCFVPTTTGNVDRGTLALRVGELRCEITTLRDSDASMPLPMRIERDLRARDMTCGAVAVELATGAVRKRPRGQIEQPLTDRGVELVGLDESDAGGASDALDVGAVAPGGQGNEHG